jgi:hypothetical protein
MKRAFHNSAPVRTSARRSRSHCWRAGSDECALSRKCQSTNVRPVDSPRTFARSQVREVLGVGQPSPGRASFCKRSQFLEKVEFLSITFRKVGGAFPGRSRSEFRTRCRGGAEEHRSGHCRPVRSTPRTCPPVPGNASLRAPSCFKYLCIMCFRFNKNKTIFI